MNNKDKYFQISNTSFHIIEIRKTEYMPFINDLNKAMPPGGFIKVINIADVHNKQEILKVFSDAFNFPDYYGHNWDAFNDCINDLTWLDASLYLLILIGIDKSEIDEESKNILLELLDIASRRWMKGENHNLRFQNIPIPFHILVVIDEGKTDKITNLLKSRGINSIDR